jgi:hypothetical protein
MANKHYNTNRKSKKTNQPQLDFQTVFDLAWKTDDEFDLIFNWSIPFDEKLAKVKAMHQTAGA